MKINWGIFAFSLFGVFVVFMLGMVYFATKQNNELVTENYYEKELEFKEILVKKEHAALLTEQVTYQADSKSFNIVFPTEITTPISGNIVFYKPSDLKADKSFILEVKNNIQSFPFSAFEKGMYHVKIDWKANDVEYYHELTLVTP